MIKKCLTIVCLHVLALLALLTTIPAAQAAVEINAASESVLQSIKGIGAARAKLIISERDKNGPYRDAEDLAERVRGLNQKSITRLEAQGLVFGNAKDAITPPAPQRNGIAQPSTPSH